MKTDTLLISTAMVLLILAAGVSSEQLNQPLFLWFNREAGILPDVFWANMTFVADTLFAVAVIAIVASRAPHIFNSGFVLLVIGALFVHGLKNLLEIPRPPAVLDLEAFKVIGPVVKNHAFPSGHSFTALATAGLLALNMRSIPATLALLAIALVAAISRAAVGAHWPLDILVGSAAGLLFALIAQKLTNDIWWLQSVGLQRFAAGLMTLTCIAMLFHDSRYPGTQLLTISAAALALLALSRYWYTSLYIERKART